MNVQLLYFLVALTLAVHVHGSAIPFVQNIALQRKTWGVTNKTVMFHGTCDECLCKVLSSSTTANSAALNCFANQTCQLFTTFPVSYNLQPSVGAQLYFLQGIFPSPSQCCMSNIVELIDRLNSATPVVVSLSFSPTTFGYDEANLSEAVVIGAYSGDLYWFNPIDMIFLRNQTISFRETIALHNHSIFTGKGGDPTVHILDQQTLAPLANITYPSLNQVHKFIFLNNGQTIVVPTQSNLSVTFINVQSPTQYTVQVRVSAVLRCVSSVSLAVTLSGRSSLSISGCSWGREGQRHVLLRLIMV